ncbi:MAG: metal-dependent hydrolase [Candidatus Thermoplasmatota archaeon]|nr:metal-dependent hydrolase [Candidatus Thermoplasmatota archaeon]
MDPLIHLLLPILFLLALRIDTRKVILFAPFAILPDFDAAFHLHRAVLHSFIPIVILPACLILYSKMKRPEWMLSSLLVLFYLSSHIVLDLGGVAFAWPFTTDMLYFDPEVTFNMQGGINFGFHLQYGVKPYVEMTTTDFVSETGFAMIFLGMLVVAVFRKEAKNAFVRILEIMKGYLHR